MSKVDNNNKNHTAHYLVSCFVHNKGAEKYSLKPADIALLFNISTYIDMNKKDHFCFAHQEKLAKEVGISRPRAAEHLLKLCSLKLLECKKERYSARYILGENLINNVNFQVLQNVTSDAQKQDSRCYETEHEMLRNVTADVTKRNTSDDLSLYDYKNDYKNRLLTPSCILPQTAEPTKMRANGNEPEVYLNSDGFLIERSANSSSPIVQNSGLPTSWHFLNFTSDNFNKVYDLWLGKKGRASSAQIWRDTNLEVIAEQIIEHLSFRIANDHEWLTALAKGEPRFIGKLENWLAREGWHDTYHTLGDIEYAKNSGLNQKINGYHQTTAERAAASYEWCKRNGEDGTSF